MRIINTDGLPAPILWMLRNDSYSKDGADFTASMMVKPVQMYVLEKRHDSEIEIDAGDKLAAMIGTLLHKALYDSYKEEVLKKNDGSEAEVRHISKVGDYLIGGKPDFYEAGPKYCWDWKYTTVWSHIFGSRQKEWEAQLNINRLLLERDGKPVDRLGVFAMYKDWSWSENQRYGERYPHKHNVVSLPVWPLEQTEKFIIQRANEFSAGDLVPDHLLPECTAEEMWQQPRRFAVMRDGRRAALRVKDTEAEAVEFMRNVKKQGLLKVVERPGECKRCNYWCAAAPFCHQREQMTNAEVLSEEAE